MQRIAISILLWIMLAWIGAFVAGRYEQNRAYEKLSEELEYLAEVRIGILDRIVERRRRDVKFLVEVPPMSGIVRASNAQQYDVLEHSSLALWKKRLETIFYAFADVNPEIRQLRLIGLADGGREIVRVDGRGGKTVIRTRDDLQQKGKTKYFQSALTLHPKEVLVTDLELNREHDKIEEPVWPTGRIIAPVYDVKNTLFGMVVMNLDGNIILDILRSTLPKRYHIYAYDTKGEFLLHPEKEKTFLKDFGKTWKWADEFTLIQAAQHAGDASLYQTPKGKFYAVSRVYVLNPKRPNSHVVTIVATASEAVVTNAVQRTKLVVFMIVFLCGVIMSTLNYFYVRQKLRMNELLERQVKERTQEVLALSELQKAILSNASYGMVTTDVNGVVTSFNPAAEKMLGYTASEVIGKVTPEIWHDEKEIISWAAQLSKMLNKSIQPGFDVLVEKSRSGLENQHEWTFIRKDRTRFPVMLGVTMLHGIGGEIIGYLGIAVDITLQRQYEEALRKAKERSDMDSEMLRVQSEKLREMAIRDPLTGLANRRYFDEELLLAARRSKRTGLALTIFMIDVDFFKDYNDRYGHQAGDEVLQRIANIFKEYIVRVGDLVARYGGEEFVCVLSTTDEKGAQALASVLLTAVRDQQLQHEGSQVETMVTISIGGVVARLSKDDDVTELVKLADEYLYEAKNQGRNRAIIRELRKSQ